MTDATMLQHKIIDANITKRELAKRLNISTTCLYSKLSNEREFKASEICAIKELLHLTDAETVHIFLQ
jgi:predicted transcriptional regulator